MKRFKFRLQRVLEYRDVLKQEKERELAEKNRNLFDREARLKNILEEQEKAKVPQGEVSMAELMLTGNYQAGLREAMVHQRLLVLEATQAVEEARDAYIEKAMETEVLETLKEKQHDLHKDEARKYERKQSDEMQVMRRRLTVGNKDDGENNG